MGDRKLSAMPKHSVCGVITVIVALWSGNLAVAGERILNGSFTTGFSGWIQSGAATGVVFSIVTSDRDATPAARIAARTKKDQGVRQNVATRLQPADNGQPFVSSLWGKLEQPATVRAYLLVTDAGGTAPHLLAEQVVRTTSTWSRVKGVYPLTWQGGLVSATFYTDIEQVDAGVFPDYVVDEISILEDADGDGVSDVAEVGVYLTATNAADTDMDGMPDGWEIDHNLYPTIPDGDQDPDADGFINREEFGAATDPHQGQSYPGRPANLNASPAVWAVLRDLALRPTGGGTNRTLSGQHNEDVAIDYQPYVEQLHTDTGQWPAILSLQLDDGTNALQTAGITNAALNYWQSGGLVLIKWSIINPWTGLHYVSARAGNPAITNDGPVDLLELVTPTQPEHVAAQTRLHGYLDEAATALGWLGDRGVVVMFRPLSEMTGSHFW